MLCMLKHKAIYVTLFQNMTAKMPGFKPYLQACCSDGEKPLLEALSQEFERSVAFLCKNHVKCSVQDKCSNLQISNAVTSIIVNDIFRSQGLAYASEKRQYREKLEELTQNWDDLEQVEQEGSLDSHHIFYSSNLTKFGIM